MLYLVATPIGNLADISVRALDTLRSVDYVASEDTRKTGRLLKHYAITKPQIAFHEHNEKSAGDRILTLLKEGQSVALVTNAGTPGIADPGFTLVRSAYEENIDVTMIPGPTALIMGLVLSGLPLHNFTFRGFPPRKSGQRLRYLDADKDSSHTLIYYESPYRLVAFLHDAVTVFGDRSAAVANDLTKLYEDVKRATLSDLHKHYAAVQESRGKLKGEYVVFIAGK